MARIVTYTIILAGVLALMNMAGLPTSTYMLLKALNFGGAIGASTLVVAAALIFSLSAVVGSIIIGFFTKQSVESSLMAGISGTMLTIFTADMYSMISYFSGICPSGSECAFVPYIITLFMFPLIAGYIISIIQWWRGSDI